MRSSLLLALVDLLGKNVEELALLLTLEQGKPLQQDRDETISCAEFLEHCSGQELRPVVLNNKPEAYAEQFFVPYVIIAGIVPWHFPLSAAISKIGPAIITGNSIIIKPAPTTPLATQRFGELIKDIVPGAYSDHRGRWITWSRARQPPWYRKSVFYGVHHIRQSSDDVRCSRPKTSLFGIGWQ